MLKKWMMIVFVFCSLIYSEVSHTGLSGTNIHTVYRWQFADSAARVNQSVSAADTMKLAYQRSDSTSWILVSTTGTRWKKIAYASNQNTLTGSNVTFNRVGVGIAPTTKIHLQDVVANPPEIRINTDGTPTALNQALSKLSLNIDGRLANITGLCETDIGGGESWSIYPKTGLSFNVTYPGGVYEVLRLSYTRNAAFYGRVTGTDFEASDSVKGVTGAFSGALSSTTLNTGLGNNELHPMDQAVLTTSDVTFDSTRTRVSKFDSLQLGTGSYLKTYVEGSFPCTLKTSDVTVQQIDDAYYTKIGNVLTISFPSLSGTSNSLSLRVYCSLPYLPKRQLVGYNYSTGYFKVSNSGSLVDGNYVYTSFNPTYINMNIPSGFTASGSKGISPCTISYITE